MDVVGNLYNFSSFTFTNGGATGRYGPTSFSSNSNYTSQEWYSTYFEVLSGIQYWYAPETRSYTITVAGAAGHNGYYSNRCRGIIIESNITLFKGMRYKIIVGQKGSVYSTGSGGGGGGTFLLDYFNNPIIIAGGGGGCVYSNASYNTELFNTDGQSGTTGGNSDCNTGIGGSNGKRGLGSTNGWGCGGAGLYGNGTEAAYATSYGYSGLGYRPAHGSVGGGSRTTAYGGFGGGGGTHGNTGGGGGGGGYSGGGGSNQSFNSNAGGGGGSYSQDTITVNGYNRDHGFLTIATN